MTTDRTDYEEALRAEIAAIRRITAALQPLSAGAKQRVIRYLADRYTDEPATPKED